ncbi:MAG: carbon-nitrogen hydrolase family protein [Coriobacteriaceae bacterium]|nr:carbon-nitrogen hydrolase family protein [Coriobacteriaceae bacterium]
MCSFQTAWGDKDANLAHMEDLVRQAAAQGAEMVVLPEMCLSGYDDPDDVGFSEKMQVRLAEQVPGPSSERMAALAGELGCWIVFGMPEYDEGLDAYFNSACIVSPDGIVDTYRKIHLPNDEPKWATRGERPVVFDSPWGKIGIGICYDIYNFPEQVAYARAKGARIFLNPTAICWNVFDPSVFRLKLEYNCLRANIYLASANLVGEDLTTDFGGASSVIGPLGDKGTIEYLCGYPFDDAAGHEEGISITDVDLGAVERQTINSFKNMFAPNPLTGEPDWRPELYASWFEEVAESPEWNKEDDA